jgi:hypothetical protein
MFAAAIPVLNVGDIQKPPERRCWRYPRRLAA